MAAHKDPLCLVELAGLEQHSVRNADLADVVQWRKQLNILHIFIVKLVFGGQCFDHDAAVVGHPLQVHAGFRVTLARQAHGNLYAAYDAA